MSGYKAQEWGDLAEPLWKGRMRIIETSKSCAIRLEDPNSGEFFAQAPYDVTGTSVESTLDSSRYFVLRVEDNGRKAYIGIGFPERPEAFDFNVALQDFTKREKAKQNPVEEEEASQTPAAPKKDYSLKEGQTFSINIPGKSTTNKSTTTTTSTDLLGGGASKPAASSGGGGFPLLPPPPSGRRG
ncbi:adaptin ear-binding coat-associated protein 1 NECAP-1 [Clavulina sp. PMI_390]|nr:adaptin ear-binding coat-associated protein 1 NECAP-1 [Clavulina sp. PMI_390]